MLENNNEVKECIKCHRVLSLSEFQKSTKTNNICKKCKAEYKKKYLSIKENREKANRTEACRIKNFIKSIKTPCIICGESEPVCIDFHHIDPTTKEFDVTLKRTKAKSKILAEVAKCVCLCSNCHRKLHAGLLDISKYTKNYTNKNDT